MAVSRSRATLVTGTNPRNGWNPYTTSPDHETWTLDVPQWASVASMLQDIAHALEAGTPVLLSHATLGGSQEPSTAAIDVALDLTWQPTSV